VFRAPLTASVAAWAAAGCVDSTGPSVPLLEETVFAEELGVDLARMQRIGAGVYIEDLEIGGGAVFGSLKVVKLHYDLWLTDGEHIQKRLDYEFTTGCRAVILGLEIGITGMHIGGRRRVVVPARVGYGPEPPWGVNVPPRANLVFEVEAVGQRSPRGEPCVPPD